MRVLFDCQNLFMSAKAVFGHREPNFDVAGLANALAEREGYVLAEAALYTGMPSAQHDPRWHSFWSRKLSALASAGVTIFNPPLRYHERVDQLPDGRVRKTMIAREKGVDVRIALDCVKHAHRGDCEALLLVSRDNDLAEAAKDARQIAEEDGRKLEVFSAYPSATTCKFVGIRGTRWAPIDEKLYNQHLDKIDHRRRSAESSALPGARADLDAARMIRLSADNSLATTAGARTAERAALAVAFVSSVSRPESVPGAALGRASPTTQ